MPGNDANTKLLLHMTGADTSTSFPDTSIGSAAHTVTANGDAQVDTAIKKWGTGSALFDGTTDYLTAPDSTDWDVFGDNTADYTVDFQIKHDLHDAAEQYISQFVDATHRWQLFHNNNLGIAFFVAEDAESLIYSAEYGEITDTNWHHVAFIRVKTIWSMYLDGSQVNYYWSTLETTLAAGIEIASVDSSQYFDGNMDELRVQADNYFLAAPNSFPEASALLYGEGVDEATTMSNDGYSGAVTMSGGAKLDSGATKFNATTSMFFDGTDDYLTVVDTSGADYDVVASATDSWTIDGWVKHTDHAGIEYYMTQGYDGDFNDAWTFRHAAGLRFLARVGGVNIVDTGVAGEISDTNWHHVAVVKNATDVGCYLDGTQTNYGDMTGTPTAFTDSLDVGAAFSGGISGPFDGNMEQVQITKGNKFGGAPVVGLTDTITVPTGVLTQDTITVPTEEYAEVVAATGRSQAVIIA